MRFLRLGTRLVAAAGALILSANSVQGTSGIGGPRKLYTSSVAYCSPPIAVLVSDLALRFYPDNSTLEFDLSAASIQDNLNITIALTVNAYGLGLFNLNIDLCSLAGGVLCPLPRYQFSGGGIVPIPGEFAQQIPNIAFNIPDLEAVATLQLTNTANNGNTIVGCVQATLSNGKTARQSGVLWATVGLALLALFSSTLHTIIAQSVGAAQWRIVDVMWAIQHPAVTSLLSLNYPTVFLSYGTNFAWSLGLVNIPSLQRSITDTRANTGGHDMATFGKNLTAQMGRKYDPYSETGAGTPSGAGKSISIGSLGFFRLPEGSDTQQVSSGASTPTLSAPISSYANLNSVGSLAKRAQYAPNTGPGGSLISGGDGVSLPLVTGNVSVNGGIGTFAERNDVAPSNAFLTVLVSMMILLAICIGAMLVAYLVAFGIRIATDRAHRKKGMTRNLSHWSHRVTKPSEFLNTVVLAGLGRYLLVVFPIMFIFIFWQWVAGDSWVGHLVAAIFFVLSLAALAGFYIPMIKHARRKTPDSLYYERIPPAHAHTVIKRWGPMAHPYRPGFYWFGAAFLAWSILRACFISFVQGHGTRQAIGLLVAEVLLFVTLCAFRVGRDKKSDFVFILLCFSRIAAWAVCIAFIPSANVRTIPRAIVGFVLLVVTALPIIYLFFLTLWDLVTPFLPSRRRDVGHGEKDAEKSEVGDRETTYGSQEGETTPSQENGADNGLQPSYPSADKYHHAQNATA